MQANCRRVYAVSLYCVAVLYCVLICIVFLVLIYMQTSVESCMLTYIVYSDFLSSDSLQSGFENKLSCNYAFYVMRKTTECLSPVVLL